ncbi:DUF3619 family protein [uncultured Rhodoferax sp.]|uniref:DUF3619 family protein n=1 Tax=uncultured Rhodoferax sp. TaxID=223188 RepID=UPI0025FA62F3|nr:DUF3619 family protein [uncultured Rhodoferax sp.]
MTSIRHARTPLSSPDALGRALASRLNDGAQQLPHEVSERLKAARMLALEKRRQAHVRLASAVVNSGGGTAALQMGGELRGVWRMLGAWLPLLALVAGMVTIDFVQDDFRAQEIADVDVELLTDDLPPDAFTDPGFAQYLRLNRAE